MGGELVVVSSWHGCWIALELRLCNRLSLELMGERVPGGSFFCKVFYLGPKNACALLSGRTCGRLASSEG